MLSFRALVRAAALAWVGASLGAGPVRLDLDVSVPPGSALEWGRAFPALTPRAGPLFPNTPGPEPGDQGRTRAPTRVVELERGLSSSFGLLRILTWDLAAHLEWVRGAWPEVVEPRTGDSAALPQSSEPLYWIAVSTLLRRLLHPALVTGPEVSTHLVELGEPVLPLLEIARGQRGLEKLCDDVRARIHADSRAWRRPLPAPDARRRMLSACVLAELTAAHPYDPDAGFGARLFLLGEDAFELVRAYTQHPDPFTRRNAVAALGRYGTREAARALVVLAATTDDDVVLVRASAALGGYRGALDVEPLAQRLAREQDPMRRAALAGALGRLGQRAALPALLAFAREARSSDDSDLLVTAVAALARIPAGPADRELATFLRNLGRTARERPGTFRESAPATPLTADVPAPARARGELLAQLATLAYARLNLDAAAMRDVLALRGSRSGARPGAWRFGSGALGELLPPAQLLWIETAASCGAEGVAALQEIARHGGTDLQVRAHALAHLSPTERSDACLELLADPEAPSELAARALELLERDFEPRAAPIARALLARCAAQPADAGIPEERQLYLVALRLLGGRGELTASDLLALEPHIARSGDPGSAPLRSRLRTMCHELVLAAREGLSGPELEERIQALVAFGVRLNPLLAQVSPAVPASQIRRALSDLSRQTEWNAALGERSADALLAILLGHGSFGVRGASTRIDPPVPLEEEIVLALGRLDPAAPAALALLERLLSQPDSPHHATACLALAQANHHPAAPAIAATLLSPDPFTRLAAAESLRHLTGLEEPIDWYTAPEPDRAAAVEQLQSKLRR